MDLMTEVQDPVTTGAAHDELGHAYDALDVLGWAVLVVTQDSRVLYANREAGRLLGRGEVVQLRDGLVVAGADDTAAALRLAIEAVADTTRCATLRLGDGYLATLQRMAYRVSGGGRSPTDAARIAVVLKHPGRGVASPAQLTDAFGMTAAEARLASAIAQGASLEQYGAEHDVRPGTLRTQLSSIFLKTGVGRQVDLVALVHAIPRCEG